MSSKPAAARTIVAWLLAGAIWAQESNQPLSEKVQLGPRPFFLVQQLEESPLKQKLQSCAAGPFAPSTFSIGHRGAPLQFPEHTSESYMAAARMGAGVLECDVTFTRDKELVCRHSQCDLHTTTNMLATPLAHQCSLPFRPARLGPQGELLEAASAQCCTSDISLSEFKSLRGKMDGFNPRAQSVAEYLQGTPSWRTELYAQSGTLLSHKESIELFKQLGVKMTPELKAPSVAMPFAGFSQQDFAHQLIAEYKQAGVMPEQVLPQSFSLQDVRYWLEQEPAFGRHAIYLDGRYEDSAFNHRDPMTWQPSMSDLAAAGMRIIAPPLWMLLENDAGRIVPSLYAKAAKQAGLEIITWTLERSGPLADGGGWYYQSLNGSSPGLNANASSLIHKDSDMLVVLDVLAREVGAIAVFSDWPATTTYYANCMGLD